MWILIMPKPRQDRVGQRLGKLTITSHIDAHRVECICDCGNACIKWIGNILKGKYPSCGCARIPTGVATRQPIYDAHRADMQWTDEGRICLKCDTWKPWAEFVKSSNRPNGRHSNCLECSRWRSKKPLGLTQDEWEWLYALQGSACALCEMDRPEARRASVDHDHACCGQGRACKECIRGILCSACNFMIGFAEQSEANRLRFADYLKRRPFMEKVHDEG